MSVTDTKEFIRMETAADKLGVDPVKPVCGDSSQNTLPF